MAVGMENPTGSPVKAKVQPKANASAAIDPLAVMRIKDLVLRAKTVVEGFYNGLHRSPFHGFSVGSIPTPVAMTCSLDWKLLRERIAITSKSTKMKPIVAVT